MKEDIDKYNYERVRYLFVFISMFKSVYIIVGRLWGIWMVKLKATRLKYKRNTDIYYPVHAFSLVYFSLL